jgi:hypothetical protein
MLPVESRALTSHFLSTLRSAVPSPAIAAARSDSNAFCEYVFRDDQRGGSPIIQAGHHIEWQRLTDEHKRLIFWYPIEHGKTTQAKMKICRLMGMHPDRQYAYISSKEDQAKKMVGAVGGEIDGNDRLREVYPRLRPQLCQYSSARQEWGKTSIRVEGCPRGSKDPSLAGYGLNGRVLGSRLHGAILDNILDSDNTNTQKGRERVIARVKDEILGRVMDDGFVWILDTAWFIDDLLHHLAAMPGWHAVKLDAEDGRGNGPTLWPAQWPAERLSFKLKELGQTAYDRQFRNRPLSESFNFFKREFWDGAYGRCPWIDEWSEAASAFFGTSQLQLRTGVDLATRKGESHDLTAFSTVVANEHMRHLVNLQSDRMEGTEIARRMVAIYRALHRPVNLAGGNAEFVVEDNAAQKYIIDMFHDARVCQSLGLTIGETSDIRVRGRTTTAKKRDHELGVQGLASAIEMGRWGFAMGEEIQMLREEMKSWTPESSHYGDRLMSLWIASADLSLSPESFVFDVL